MQKKKILIITNGTRGDVEPFVGLAQGLIQNGYHVTICAPISFKKFVTDHGIAYAYMNNGLPKIVLSEIGRHIMESSASVARYIRSGLKSKAVLRPSYRRQLDETFRAAKQVKPDLIIFNHVSIYGHHIARELRVPAMVAVSSPLLIPTGDVAHLLFPQWKLWRGKLGRAYNRLTYRIFFLIVEQVTKYLVREWQDDNHLARYSNKIEFYRSAPWQGRPMPVLYHYSQSLSPHASDWDNNIHITGYWFRKESHKTWTPPTRLINFINAGTPPLYIGFGSMTASRQTLKRVIDAMGKLLTQTEHRAVIAAGWSKEDWQSILADKNIAEKIYYLDEAPHDWLFPQMAGIIHHGGAGTTAAAFRALKPSIICPFFADQHFWAKRIKATKSGMGPLPLKKINHDNLSRAVTKITTDPIIIANAKKIGQAINKEDGIAATIAIIKKFMTQKA